MSGNFEVLPCGTQARLAAVEAERDALREILDDIPPIEAELAETSDKLHAMTVERDALLAALEKIAGFTMSHFMGRHDMALECVTVARAAIDAVRGGGNG